MNGKSELTSNVVRADREISNLEALDAVDVKALIEHTVLDDAVALLGRHGAGSQAVPGALDVALDPLLDGLDVLGAVLQLVADLLVVRVEVAGDGLLLGLGQRARPAAVAQAGRQVAGQGVGLGRQEVHVVGAGG